MANIKKNISWISKVSKSIRKEWWPESKIERLLRTRLVSIFWNDGNFMRYVCNNTKYDDETKYALIWLVSDATEKQIMNVVSLFDQKPRIWCDDFECLKIAVQKSKKY